MTYTLSFQLNGGDLWTS